MPKNLTGEIMNQLLIVFLIVVAAFIFLSIVFVIKQRKKGSQPHYICSQCGEHQCDCHKQ